MALSSALDSLLPQNLSLLLILASFVVIPYLTHQLSIFLFYRTARSPVNGKRPPIIPYWIPGVYHAFSILAQGPPAFFANAM